MPAKSIWIPRTCGTCQKAFEVQPSIFARGDGKFCSRSCAAASMAKKLFGRREPIENRFWAKVEKRGPNECWLWTGCTQKFGHGSIARGGRNGKRVLAHRLSWEIHFGEIPDGMLVCHHCDAPQCVNPRHLFIGTYLHNNRDKNRKKRDQVPHPRMSEAERGEKNNMAKLNIEQVRAIRAAYVAGGVTYFELGRQYGVAHTTIYKIVRGRRWTHI
jgi:hypothetical protein